MSLRRRFIVGQMEETLSHENQRASRQIVKPSFHVSRNDVTDFCIGALVFRPSPGSHRRLSNFSSGID